MEFLRKYIQIAKYIKPQMPDKVSTILSTYYATKLRVNDCMHTATLITIRTLEALIRLAAAHAKSRLSTKVSVEDTNAAIKLLTHTLTNTTININTGIKLITDAMIDDTDAMIDDIN